MATVLSEPNELLDLVGTTLGTSEWVEVTQEKVNRFADATDDHQWIHVDPERAAAGPFGGTIAHGFFTLCLAPAILGEVVRVTGEGDVLNYGLNKVRFTAPVPVGGRIRAEVGLVAARQRADVIEVTVSMTYELSGQEKPVCVAEMIFLYRPRS